MIKYSYTYGVVLSGAMENTGTSIKNYVSDNRQYIAQMVEKTVPQLKVTFEKIVLRLFADQIHIPNLKYSSRKVQVVE